MTGSANAVVICVDTSDYMRNEDYVPSRWVAQAQAVTWLLQELASTNECSVVAVKGGRPSLMGTATTRNKAYADLLGIPSTPFSCGCSRSSPYRFLPSLQLAQLLLRNRRGGRVVVFCGSPTGDSLQQLEPVVTSFKDSGIMFDIVAFGDADVDLWEKLDGRYSLCTQDGLTIEETISSLRWDSHEEDPPPAPSSSAPVLRMPSPSRVCRRVVVDSTKVPAHSLSLSLSLMLSLSLPSPSGSPSRDRVVLMVSVPSQRNKKILVEFRAGRCLSSSFSVRPLRKKGQLAVLQVHDHLLQFIWRDRVTGQVALDVSVHAGEGTFKRVPSHITPARIYYLHIFDPKRKYFFWMQNPDSSMDDANCALISDFLNNAPPPSPSSSSSTSLASLTRHSSALQSLAASHPHLDPADIPQLLAMYRSPPTSPIPSPSISPLPSPSSSPTTSPSSSISSFAGSRKWIKNPAWTPPTTTTTFTPSSSSSSTSSSSSSSSYRHTLSPPYEPLFSRSEDAPRRFRVSRSSPELPANLAQTLASPAAAAAAASGSLPELGIGTNPSPPITQPAPLPEQGATPLEGAPPPPPPHDRQ